MAPAYRVMKSGPGKKQPVISSFTKVSKAASTIDTKILSTQVVPAVQDAENKQATIASGKKKRKCDDLDSDSSSDPSLRVNTPLKRQKKLRPISIASSSSQASVDDDVSPPSLQSLCTTISTPPTSSHTVVSPNTSPAADLPAPIRNIISLHENFLKALSIHYAHNGPATPAELGSLMKTTTCLWKRHTVRVEDVQRMLALYELCAEPETLYQPREIIVRKHSPFKLSKSTQITIEYVGSPGEPMLVSTRSPFSEKHLQCLFDSDIWTLYKQSQTHAYSHLSFLTGTVLNFPMLQCSIGVQTAARQEKASNQRKEILGLAAAAQPKPIKQEPIDLTEIEDSPGTKLAVKARTMSLFDRIAAKQIANASSSTPTAAEIQRSHAIGRIDSVVEVLRMKQAQKSVGRQHFISSVNSVSPPKAMGARVSFSMRTLKQEIRDSGAVPMAEQEIELCLRILAEEGDGKWLKIWEQESGDKKIAIVVLEGKGKSGKEIQKVLEAKGMGKKTDVFGTTRRRLF